MKRIWICLCLAMLLTACAGVPAQQSAMPQESPGVTVNPDGRAFFEQDTMEASALAFREQMEVLGYQVCEREEIRIDGGAKVPCRWLFAVNDYGDFMDYIMMPAENEIEMEFLRVSTMPIFHRSEELGKFVREYGVDNEVAFASTFWSATRGDDFLYSCMTHPVADAQLGNPMGMDCFSIDGELVPIGTREPSYTRADGWLAPCTVEEEIEGIIDGLRKTGKAYFWQIRDISVPLDGQEYVVKHLSIGSTDGDFAELYFCEDPDFAYTASFFPEALPEGQQELRLAWEESYRSVKTYQNAPITSIVRDCFFNGYSVYMRGRGLTLLACGSQSTPWDYVLCPEGMLEGSWKNPRLCCASGSSGWRRVMEG